MILQIFTLVHVLISLVGIFTGLLVLAGMLAGKGLNRWTSLFLWTTIATSVTGFFFPVKQFMPSHAVGILSLILLGAAVYARGPRRLTGIWAKIFSVTTLLSLYFNVFVLVAQSFQKIPALHALAPTQAEPPFAIAQGVVLLGFIVMIVIATIKFRPARF